MSYASNPAKTKVMMMHFLKCDLKDLIILVGGIVVGAALILVTWKLAVIIMATAVVMFFMSISSAKTIFSEGDLCPGIVVDQQRNLIAVFTDLSKTNEPHCVVKVLKQPLGRLPGRPFKEGKRLAFVAMYNGFPKDPIWKNFGGYLINTGTTSKKAIHRALESISEKEWKRLERAVDRLEDAPEKGLFEV